MITINREELAWAAGFFDGEGTTGYSIKTIRAVIAQINREALDRFNSATGNLGRVKGPYAAKSIFHQEQWRYETSSFESVQAVIAMLWPFLSNVKRHQAANALTAAIQNRRDVRNKCSSQFKGVSYNRRTRKWVAQHYKNKEHTYLGSFTTELEAKKAYDNHVIKLRHQEWETV